MNYYQYKAEDFAADDDFKSWVCKPDRGSEAFWNDFLKEFPEKYYDVEEGRRLVLGLSNLPPNPAIDEGVHSVWERLEKSIQRKPWGAGHWYLSAAALLLLGIALGWGMFLSAQNQFSERSVIAENEIEAAWEEAINNTSTRMQIELADGSKVVLEKDSRIRYQQHFNDSLRLLHLAGEAFFEVEKDASRPFMVIANGLVTRVLGTSFSIHAREEDRNVTVEVKTGRVSVYSERTNQQTDPESNGVVLTPNQKVVFERGSETLRKTLVEKPEAVKLVPPALFAFEAAPARKIFETLASVYGIEVIFNEEVFEDCRLTVDLTQEDLYQKLEVNCKVLDAKYKLIDAQVIIDGTGCY